MMGKKRESIVHRRLFSWVWGAERKLQLMLVATVAVAVVARVIPLEMQKRIVNEAIAQADIQRLMIYCTVYLAAFVTASGLKFVINSLQAIISQNTLAEMRQQLWHHILKLPDRFFRRTQSGLIVTSLTTELAAAGDFVGLALAVPLINVLTLLAFAGYLFWLNPILAAISFSIYPMVLVLVPRLQRRVNHYNRKRVDATRQFSGKVGESVEGINEIKANAAIGLERRLLDERIEKLRKIRVIWNLYRFAVKVTNNLFTNFSRFLIFSLGGYLALKGELELGALVAFLSAQEKLYDPWKELIQFYQVYQTASVTYRRTQDYFDHPTEGIAETHGQETGRLGGRLEVDGLAFVTPEGVPLLKDVSFALDSGEHMALVGESGSGKSTLLHCLLGLYPIFEGRCRLEGRSLPDLSRRELSANIGFVSQSPAIFSGTLQDNLLYACRALAEGRAHNPDEVPLPDLDRQIEALQQSGLFADVLGLGLSSPFDPRIDERLRLEVLKVRRQFEDQHAQSAAEGIEIYDAECYLNQATVAENLLFGRPVAAAFAEGKLPFNPHLGSLLKEFKLWEPLLELGERFAAQVLDRYGRRSRLPANIPLTPKDWAALRKILKSGDRRSLLKLPARHQHQILKATLAYISGRHDMIDMPRALMRKIVAGRRRVREALSRQAPGAVAFYGRDTYIEGASILENIIFGRTTSEDSEVITRINTDIIRLLVEEELLEAVLAVGMKFEVGKGGENLSGGQRQKLVLARALLKETPVLFLDEATASLDTQSQARIQSMLESRLKGNTTLLAVVHRLDIIKNYDKIAVMQNGRIKELGGYDEIMGKEVLLYRMVQARG
jgi:ABC-type multidrug transport system fused ATPase/permease subunit